MGKKFDELVKDAKPFKEYVAEGRLRPDVDLRAKTTTIGKRDKSLPQEKETQKAILEWLKANRIFSWRNNTQGRIVQTKAGAIMSGSFSKGSADILGCLPNGRFLAIEVKSPGGKISAEQQNFIDSVRRNGGVGLIVTTVDEVIRTITGILRETETKLSASF